MQLARVIGTVVATVKDPELAGKKLLLVSPLAGPSAGAAAIVALDAVGAGVGELVYFARGREASLAWDQDPPPPTDAAVVGIADPTANPQLAAGLFPRAHPPAQRKPR
ncbi:MAG: EutN/CcmL family microcompartment protein [Terriglobales bacterium]